VTTTFRAVNPATGQEIEPTFRDATPDEIDAACRTADDAFDVFRRTDGSTRAKLLTAIADAILALGDDLIERAIAETGLPRPRLESERARTINQLKQFADAARDGAWIGARIDRAMPDRKPVPKPDLRLMHVPLGPVAVFGASNFPLAFSVAGGDTASALAAGCPVVVKAHPAHPGTCDRVAGAVRQAVRACGLPDGLFGMVHGRSPDVGAALVTHPLIRAVGFTGSLAGGRALFDLASRRAEPIPVFAEMGSANPVFLLPGALARGAESIAEGFVTSATLSVGQFCTQPGLVFAIQGADADRFAREAARRFGDVPPGTMLHAGIRDAFERGVRERTGAPALRTAARGKTEPLRVGAALFATDARGFESDPRLAEELFGPSSIFVSCATREQMLAIARRMRGSLTATIHGSEQDLVDYRELVEILACKAGRLIFNGFPTGVEVCPSMMHGGPYPATTDSRFTSVGVAAIQRWLRPVCFQNFPSTALPPPLRDRNEAGLWRLIDGTLTKENA
jgi:NADP-dependent aldehyde dehydrogenase